MRLLPQASSYSATTVRSGATQHQCPESKRVRQQIVTGPKTQGVQQTKLALPSIFQTPQQYIAPPDVRDEMARGQRSSFTSQSVISRSSGCDDRYSDHMSARRQDDFNSRMTDVTRRAPVYESSWPHDNRPPPVGLPPHEPSRGYNSPFEPARGYDMPLRSGPAYDSRPSVDERFPPWQTGSYTENRQYCGDLPAGSPTYGGDYSGRGGYPGPYGYQDSGSFPPERIPIL